MNRIKILSTQLVPVTRDVADSGEREDRIMWYPSEDRVRNAAITKFISLINSKFKTNIKTYEDLHAWSVAHTTEFWSECWDSTGVVGSKGSIHSVHMDDMLKAQFFPNSHFNFSENCLKRLDDAPAIISTCENIPTGTLSWRELHDSVGRVSNYLRDLGIQKGDRVCAVVPNVPETVICMLAVGALGAVWSSVSPDFGVEGIYERFNQIEPKILFYSNFYKNKDKRFSVTGKIEKVMGMIQSKPIGIEITNLLEVSNNYSSSIQYNNTNFNDPIFIMFSSGTTGKPKCILHRHGCLLQLMKEHQFHCDIKSNDRVFYYTTTTWMMWNWLISVLASNATILLYEGNPSYPSPVSIFEFNLKNNSTFCGISAKFIDSLKSDSITLPQISTLRTIASTGSPLVPESFDYIYSQYPGVNLASISGGTDILSCFMLGCPVKPVKRGFVQCRGLGMDVRILNDSGQPVVGVKGELVCATPFPSQPLGFYGDGPNQELYRSSYFSDYPNVWKHGDYCLIDSDGHLFVYGRSDSTLKPGGVRIGTAEIYRSVESLPYIAESVCVGVETKPGEESVALFVVLKNPEAELTAEMRREIQETVARKSTRHHVPKIIHKVSQVPKTQNGKIVEIAVKNVIHNRPVKNVNALINAECLREFEQFRVNYSK
jgi:acetoacetyl-CoA synthetase